MDELSPELKQLIEAAQAVARLGGYPHLTDAVEAYNKTVAPPEPFVCLATRSEPEEGSSNPNGFACLYPSGYQTYNDGLEWWEVELRPIRRVA